ncbi:3-hydroxyacyl-CoA dehydrogenase family protein [Marivirga harenae]|uniref:3-hydroxyacyl-CoA dehydrogenase family protein n=1 Tax=Marivirga harenae TaxID=2010992 RepID=UPI0026DF0711|nr:3-hydroxyacyl-CoA dehydrogenase family protein [Marivirga harenae]WKV13185.1 3-hydroxyacyl-CoA dehydrogenase family protein [Marivirga harenae]|tara:strand:- start:347990 stop:348658 length:669 start_codon:yes stop_codon:yes gene_type:complete
MNILVVGDPKNQEEITAKFGKKHQIISFDDLTEITKEAFFAADVVFDFFIAEEPEALEFYEQRPDLTVFTNMAMSSFGKLKIYQHKTQNTVFGFNGLPTFINRSILECTLQDENEKEKLNLICGKLGTEFEIVEDRVGMVTPRIICMIINEAFYTVQEGTASSEDIDLGMKLGTNYPFGPFEWSEKIGLENVYELLEFVYDDTKEERYKICPRLKKEYLALT